MRKIIYLIIVLALASSCFAGDILSKWNGIPIRAGAGSVQKLNGKTFSNHSTGHMARWNTFKTYSTQVVANTLHQYWRIIATGTNYVPGNSYNLQYYTISFFTSTDGTGTDLNLSGTAYASQYAAAGYEPSKANDNNNSTEWAAGDSAATFQWWGVDLGANYQVHSLFFLSVNSSGNYFTARAMDLQYCTDNTFTTCTTQSSFNPTNTGSQTFTGL